MLWTLFEIGRKIQKYNPGAHVHINPKLGSDLLSLHDGERAHVPYEAYLIQPSQLVPQIINRSLVCSPKVPCPCLHCHISPSLFFIWVSLPPQLDLVPMGISLIAFSPDIS